MEQNLDYTNSSNMVYTNIYSKSAVVPIIVTPFWVKKCLQFNKFQYCVGDSCQVPVITADVQRNISGQFQFNTSLEKLRTMKWSIECLFISRLESADKFR